MNIQRYIMKLSLCTSCNQYILKDERCPYCERPSSASLTIPIAMMLGFGCTKNGTQPSPEIMALYGGPPVEMELEITDTSTPDETSKEESEENKEPSKNEQQSQSAPKEDSETPQPLLKEPSRLYIE